MELVAKFASNVERGLIAWSVITAVLVVIEIFNAREPMPLSRRFSGVAFWIAAIPVSAALGAGFSTLWTATGVRPLVTLPMFEWLAWTGPLAGVFAVVGAAIVADLFFYWYHRAQHRWFWRYHAVHHSIRDLSAVNSYHHISETLFGLVLLTLPLSLVVTDVGPVLPLANLLVQMQIVWIHSPTRSHLGPLQAIIADNRFHRIHHSLEERHFDRNFGAFTTLWDRLFGTAYFPKKDEWPAVGLAGISQPLTLKQWVTLPSAIANPSQNDGSNDVVNRAGSAGGVGL